MASRKYSEVKEANSYRYDIGQCFQCHRNRYSDSPLCTLCLSKKTIKTVKAYRKKHPNARVNLCGSCDKPGHNTRTCGRVIQ